MTKSDKFYLYLTGTITVIMVVAAIFSISSKTEQDSKIDVCEEMGIKFGSEVVVNSGFYKGVRGTVVAKSAYVHGVTVQHMAGLTLTEKNFMCEILTVLN